MDLINLCTFKEVVDDLVLKESKSRPTKYSSNKLGFDRAYFRWPLFAKIHDKANFWRAKIEEKDLYNTYYFNSKKVLLGKGECSKLDKLDIYHKSCIEEVRKGIFLFSHSAVNGPWTLLDGNHRMAEMLNIFKSTNAQIIKQVFPIDCYIAESPFWCMFHKVTVGEREAFDLKQNFLLLKNRYNLESKNLPL